MTQQLGQFSNSFVKTHVGFQFSTFDAAGANVAPSSAFEAADLRIYRRAYNAANSATQRSSASGVTMTSPFDSLTGYHDVDIDLTDNTDAGFYAPGYIYTVVLSPDETVDSQTITGVVLAKFEIVTPGRIWALIGGTVNERGGRIIHWAPSGGSSSNPGTRDQPLDTHANAESAATAGRDTIYMLAGTSTTAISVSKTGLILDGDGDTSFVDVSGGGAALTVTHDTTVRNMRARGSHSATGVGIVASSTRNVTLERVLANGTLDGIQFNTATNGRVSDCRVTGTFDGMVFSSSQLIVENSTFDTDGTYNVATPARALVGTGAGTTVVLNNVKATTTCTNAHTAHRAALVIGGGSSGEKASAVCIGCNFRTTSTSGSATGKVSGIAFADGTSTPIHATLGGGSIVTANAGSGNTYDIDANVSGSCIAVDGVATDRSKWNGTANIFEKPTAGSGTNQILLTSGVARANDASGNAVAPAATALSTATWTVTIAGRIDAAISTRAAPGAQMDLVNAPNATAVSAIQSGLASQSSVNDLPTNAEFAAALPANFAAMGISASGHVSRVTLVDTTTANTDMRGTDGANTTTPDNAGIAAAQAAAETAVAGIALVKQQTDELDFTGTGGALKSESTNMRGTDNALPESSYTAPPSASTVADAVATQTTIASALSTIGTNLDAKVSEAGGGSFPLEGDALSNFQLIFGNGGNVTAKVWDNLTSPKQVTIQVGN